MKRLILHVGTHKTGTSYLQLWLHHNRGKLASQGTLYPDFFMKMPNANHHGMADAIKHGQLDFSRTAEQLASIASTHENVILSSETFSSLFHRGRNDAARFKEAFGEFFSITISIYLRRQDDMLESAYAEIVKTGNAPPIEEMLARPYNWLARLQYLSEVFGPGNVVARPYYPKAWSRGHLAKDFLSSSSLPVPHDAEDVERANEAMSRRKTLFLSMVDKARIPNISKFIEQVRRSSAITDDGIKCLMAPHIREGLVSKHSATNEKLCDRFFGGKYKEYFLSSPPDNDSWVPPMPISVEEMIEFQQEVWTRAVRAEARCRVLEERQRMESSMETQP